MTKLESILIYLLDKGRGLLSYIFHLFIKNQTMREKAYIAYDKLSRIGIKSRIENKNNRKKYMNDKKIYCQLNHRKSFELKAKDECPIINEWNVQNGGGVNTNGYFWQDLWGAKKIIEKMPSRHFDIGSSVDGFISHLLVVKMPVTLIDIRPMEAKLPGVDYIQADATELNGIDDNSIESLSALCSLEHFGLGRYGDTIDPEACFKAFKAVQRVVKPGGYIYISLPVGRDRVCFNAHRVFNPDTVIREFDRCSLEEYSVVDASQNPALLENCDLQKYYNAEKWHTGLFCFRKNG